MTPILMASPSAATDAAWLAAADVAHVATSLRLKYRLIGGIAVTLLNHHYGVQDEVPGRETADADMGMPREVCSDERLPVALHELGYVREGGNRFVRPRDDGQALTIDVLAASLSSRMEPNHQLGDLSVDLIPGLTTALLLDPVPVTIDAILRDGSTLTTTLDLPDVIGALTLKAFAYRDRLKDRDAIDIWRLLVAADAAGVTVADWPTTSSGRDAGALLHTQLARPNSATVKKILPRAADQARFRLLLRKVVARGR